MQVHSTSEKRCRAQDPYSLKCYVFVVFPQLVGDERWVDGSGVGSWQTATSPLARYFFRLKPSDLDQEVDLFSFLWDNYLVWSLKLCFTSTEFVRMFWVIWLDQYFIVCHDQLIMICVCCLLHMNMCDIVITFIELPAMACTVCLFCFL